MKLSKFNLILPTKTEGEYLLANMMSGAVIAIDEEMKTLIENENVHHISQEQSQILQDLSILLPDKADEYRKFKVRYEKKKYTVKEPNFTLIPTYACNLACPYCYEGKGEVLKGTMNKDTRERAANFIKYHVKKYKSNKFSIALYGGEPLLNFDDCAYIMDSCFQWADDQGIDY
ncbi:MAG: 4Fe-4S cluster-binding domain-containing protein, partial [Candidatus Methanofastidiosia archaeon]